MMRHPTTQHHSTTTMNTTFPRYDVDDKPQQQSHSPTNTAEMKKESVVFRLGPLKITQSSTIEDDDDEPTTLLDKFFQCSGSNFLCLETSSSDSE